MPYRAGGSCQSRADNASYRDPTERPRVLRSGIYDNGPANPLVLDYDERVPAVRINACGTQFGEWVDETLVAEERCVTFDPDDGCNDSGLCQVNDDTPPVAHPLVLQVFLTGQAGTSRDFRVELP